MKKNKKIDNTSSATLETKTEDIISKSSVKRALQDILLFGEKLLSLNSKQLSRLPLSDLLLTEIELAKKLKVDNSRRRQLQRIAKILRSENHEEIQATYNTIEEQNRQHHQSGNPTEKWCEQLIENSKSLSEFILRHPETNRQQLSQLIRNAKKERGTEEKTQKNQQRLFKFIQEVLTQNL